MPYARIATPLVPGAPADIFYREVGAGPPILVLHGGWGYGFYPFDTAFAALPAYRFVIPDRTGYGRSPRVAAFPADFHAAAASEHLALLDALAIERCVVWGHSDGAVIAAHLALRAPERVSRLVLEALHVDREKLGSRPFFTMMAHDPDGFGPRVTDKLAAEHGADWRTPIMADGKVWLELAAQPGDLYGGRLRNLAMPTLVLHGSADPRTEPGELDQLRDLPNVRIACISEAGHAPHSERMVRDEACSTVVQFLTTT